MSVFIDNCSNTVVKIDKKCNMIFVNNCVKTTIIFNQIVSSVEAMNCKNLNIICLDICPAITLDKCQESSIKLNKDLITEIITSQCAETNITWMETDEPAKDTPVPESFVTKWNP
jgi:adenylyl cyclase-associated protein